MRASDPPCGLSDFGYNQWHNPSMKMTTKDLYYGRSPTHSMVNREGQVRSLVYRVLRILNLVEAIGRSGKEGSDILAKSNNHQH